MPIACRQLLNFLIFPAVERRILNLHSPSNAALVAEFHQRWWFSAKQSIAIGPQVRLQSSDRQARVSARCAMPRIISKFSTRFVI
jgi:hypothetical protein